MEQRYRLSWSDSLIVAAAAVQSCALLLSEDLEDQAVYGGVTVRSPFTLSAEEATTAYSAAPSVASRHPARGRPRARRADAVRAKVAERSLTERDVADAVAQARAPTRKTRK